MSHLCEVEAGVLWEPTTRPDSAWLLVHPKLGISLMDHLYNRLDGAYPGRWRKDFPDPQSVENWRESWVEAFEEEGITQADVAVAMRKVRKRFNWPPSIAEFIQLARPPVDVDQAYHEAVAGLLERRAGRMGEWSHRAIYWAAQELQYDLLTQSQEQMKARWKRALAKQLDRSSHEDIPALVTQLPAPGHTQLEREEARRLLAHLRASDIVKRPGGQQRLGWAQAIMERVERKDPTLTRAIIHSAEAALAKGGAEYDDEEISINHTKTE